MALALAFVAVLTLDVSFPDPSDAPILCPKVEYREVARRGRIVRDTITHIPEACR